MPFATLRLLPPSNRAKGAEFLSLCDRITVLERQLGPEEVQFSPEVRTLLAQSSHRCPARCCAVCAYSYGRTRFLR